MLYSSINRIEIHSLVSYRLHVLHKEFMVSLCTLGRKSANKVRSERREAKDKDATFEGEKKDICTDYCNGEKGIKANKIKQKQVC
uniref:Uncharacterized protein n=1 Tax=Nelumbo nucifera TaxID=4432 RepID=A0A822YV29_NELNU|nr:TPA_asm: hypothetical protein HUJ06_007021 [Nelumbo nucifera]